MQEQIGSDKSINLFFWLIQIGGLGFEYSCRRHLQMSLQTRSSRELTAFSCALELFRLSKEVVPGNCFPSLITSMTS